MMRAETPNIIIRSLKKGTAITLSLAAFAIFFNSIHLKKRNNKKEILQIKVTFEKNLKSLIIYRVIKNFHNNILKKNGNDK